MKLILFLFLIVVCAWLYFAPTIISSRRNVPFTGFIFLLNVVIGWTGLGWFFLLLVAFCAQPGQPDVNITAFY